MKSAIGTLCPAFNTHRMVHEYTERFYLPGHARLRALSADDAVPARELSQWKARVASAWDQVQIRSVDADAAEVLRVGDELEVRARIALGSLGADDVVVELYHGEMDAEGEIVDGEVLPMTPESEEGH
jgi:starch phosphorylase